MIEILKNKNLFLLWMGQVLSLIGSRMFSIALAWHVIATESKDAGLKMGILLVVCVLPYIIFAKLIGRVVDRYDPKKIILISDLIAFGVILLYLLLIYFIPNYLLLIYFISFTLSLCSAFLEPTLLKSVNYIVPDSLLEKSVALISSTSSFSFFIGALFGASAMSLLGLRGSVIVNGLSYFLALLFTLSVKFYVKQKNEGSINKDSANDPVFSQNIDVGRKKKILNQLLFGFGFINFFSTPLLVLLPLYVKNILSGSATQFAQLEAGLYFGMIFGAFIATYIPFQKKNLLVGAISIFFMGLFIFLLSYVESLFFSILFVILATASVGLGNVKFLALFQSVVPHHEKGSFFASLSAMAQFFSPLAFFLFGLLADSLAISTLFIIQGIGVMILSCLFFIISHKEKFLWN